MLRLWDLSSNWQQTPGRPLCRGVLLGRFSIFHSLLLGTNFAFAVNISEGVGPRLTRRVTKLVLAISQTLVSAPLCDMRTSHCNFSVRAVTIQESSGKIFPFPCDNYNSCAPDQRMGILMGRYEMLNAGRVYALSYASITPAISVRLQKTDGSHSTSNHQM